MFSSIHTCCSQKLTYLFNEQLNSLINPNNIFEYIHKELSSFQWQQFKSQCNDFFQFLFLSVSWNRQFPNFNLFPQSSLPNFTIKLKHAPSIANYLSPPPPFITRKYRSNSIDPTSLKLKEKSPKYGQKLSCPFQEIKWFTRPRRSTGGCRLKRFLSQVDTTSRYRDIVVWIQA